MTYQLLHGDALTLLRTLPEASVNCVVTSPPYWGLRTYDVEGQLGMEKTPEEYIAKMTEVFREVRRVLDPRGTAWVNLGDCYHNGDKGGYAKNRLSATDSLQKSNLGANFIGAPNRQPHPTLKPKDLCMMPARVALALQADGWYLRQDIVWAKTNPMPESVRDRCTKAHEYLFLLSKSKRYYFDQAAIKEPASKDSHARYARPGNKTHRGADSYAQGDEHHRTKSGLVAYAERMRTPAGWHQGTRPATPSGIRDQRTAGVHPKAAPAGSGIKANESFGAAVKDVVELRNKRSVWTLSTQAYKGSHFATFPEKLVEPCILAGCPVGGLVLDPFCGSGTVGVVALRRGRRFLGIDLNAEYVQMAHERIAKSLPPEKAEAIA